MFSWCWQQEVPPCNAANPLLELPILSQPMWIVEGGIWSHSWQQLACLRRSRGFGTIYAEGEASCLKGGRARGHVLTITETPAEGNQKTFVKSKERIRPNTEQFNCPFKQAQLST